LGEKLRNISFVMIEPCAITPKSREGTQFGIGEGDTCGRYRVRGRVFEKDAFKLIYN